jgi:NAD(P)-dependent dehydrogenase (short-subunit alcohol dehydrogenase family)
MPDRLLADQVALVTGAASGIGRATALRLAAEGARLALADRDLEGLRAAAAEIGAGALAVPLDVTSESDWDAAMKTVEAQWGRLDIAVCAAGISHAAPVDATTLEDWRRVMAVNVDGCFLGLRAGVRMFRMTPGRVTAERPGRVVLVSSVSGRKAIAGALAYAASKAAVSMLARSAALELAPAIRVNAFLPGAVRTPMCDVEDDAVLHRPGEERGEPGGCLARHGGGLTRPRAATLRRPLGDRRGDPLPGQRRQPLRHRRRAGAGRRLLGLVPVRGRCRRTRWRR